MNIRTFDLERIQSLYENTVPINLTESGFHPYTLEELLTPDQIKMITSTVLGYGQTNGSIPLRQIISKLYPNCNEDNILVTNGSAEANFIACHTILKPGDEVVMMVPNYMQIWGIVEEMGCTPKKFHLKEEHNWKPDLEELESKMNSKTNMIALCNPNNPTGYVLSLEEMKAIVNIAKKYDAWIYCDEVYKGADLDNVEKPSFYGMYDKVMVNGGLSKAYALPGLRLGWLVGPEKLIANTWAYHDYTSITAGILSHKIGEIVLQPEKRKEVLRRNISMLNENLKITQEWTEKHGDSLEFVPPKAGGMVFIKYKYPINSTELSDWLRLEKGVFILAGDVYGMDKHFRIGIGAEKKELIKGYEILSNALNERFNV
ncbi:aminotransferase class I/II-fold pyridoxal phosphate-dependent enzyme [uncultured Psychroserpens sp.]|uniref:aminotransferase class I/II-fold pyridoxal phosphate-dependent enzyme n=1 Tax=uncultured Psychroserpens sp. TaxID=255436 RepID=UPI002606B0FD|nr:aminotransferase class I/II-fold pyridoxal phosphate-dependent enzyme [uncultured Psychroserpens sp.]